MVTQTLDELRAIYREHLDSPGVWPADFPLVIGGRVEEGLVVRSLSGTIEGRTTGSRRRCASTGRLGWFVGVSRETRQRLFPCSKGWAYDAVSNSVRLVVGGEVIGRVVSPKPLGVDPTPREEWPARITLTGKGWRVHG